MVLCSLSILLTARFLVYSPYWLVADSNKFLGLLFSISAFLYFKNLKIGYSKVINTIAASAFGVLLIHAHSDTMRRWLWRDVCNNVDWIDSPYCWLHAIGCVFAVYAICLVIDLFYLRVIEKRLLDCIEGLCKKIWKCCDRTRLAFAKRKFGEK